MRICADTGARSGPPSAQQLYSPYLQTKRPELTRPPPRPEDPAVCLVCSVISPCAAVTVMFPQHAAPAQSPASSRCTPLPTSPSAAGPDPFQLSVPLYLSWDLEARSVAAVVWQRARFLVVCSPGSQRCSEQLLGGGWVTSDLRALSPLPLQPTRAIPSVQWEYVNWL